MRNINKIKDEIVEKHFIELSGETIKILSRNEDYGDFELKNTPSGYFIYADNSFIKAPENIIIGGIARELSKIVVGSTGRDFLYKMYSNLINSPSKYESRRKHKAEELMISKGLGSKLIDYWNWNYKNLIDLGVSPRKLQ